MVVFPNCKINLGLSIVQKREDGFHDLETAFYPVKFHEALEAISSSIPEKEIAYSSSGIKIEGTDENNLCVRAFQLIKKDFPELPSIKLHLHKAIPSGAGLGGGSADAAFTLKLLNEKFQLNIPEQQLINYATQLGSDCPFFIINQPCFATGRGEILQKINVDLSGFKIALINPGIHINTAWAFTQLTPQRPAISIKEIILQPIVTWKENLKNDFEKPIFDAHPEIKTIKEKLYKMGALYTSMSGSGSTVFGIFDKEISLVPFKQQNYFTKLIPC